MSLKVVEATEADVAEMIWIEHAAYKGSIGERLLFPHGRNVETLDLQINDILEEMREDPTVRNIKVIDADCGDRSIAYARWHFYFGDSEQHKCAGSSRAAAIPGADPAGQAMWNDVVRARRHEYIWGKPHFYLSNLVTHPENQGRGAGTMLTRWGCKIADDNGMPTFLQATPAGRKTYEYCGFKEAYAISLDMAKVGLDGVYKTSLMVRYARTRPSSESRVP